MRPELRFHADRQAGLVTRAQAVAAGCTERELRTATAVRGPWVVVRRGVYVERDHWSSLTGPDEQARLRDLAAHLVMTTPHVMSHDSAARALRLPLLRPHHELGHVTRRGVGGSRTEHGVKHHLTRIPLLPHPFVDGMPVTRPSRTAVDLAREHGLRTGVVACDAALAAGLTTRTALAAELEVMWCWPGITRARAAVQLADPGAESPGESLLRLLVLELGIGKPVSQFPVRIAGGTAWADLRVGCHLFEFDGRVKFLPPSRGGIAERPIEDIVWDERERQRLVCAEGLGMSRVGWQDVFGEAVRERTKRRLLAEYAVTRRRFGVELPPHLAEFAARMRGRRRAS